MDIIDYAVQQEPYLSEQGEILKQTWDDFDRAVKGKKLYLFGAGAGADYFFTRYGDRYLVTGILDNDERWHGYAAGDVMVRVFETVNEEARFMPVSALEYCAKEETLVLITSTKYYQEMGKQLLEQGITEYYVLLMMEANRRKCHGGAEANRGGQQVSGAEIKREGEHVPGAETSRGEQYVPEAEANRGEQHIPAAGKAADVHTVRQEYAAACCSKPIQDNKIVFRSFGTYSDHGKYITEQLLKLSHGLDIVWILKDLREEAPEGVRVVWTGNWKKCIYEMETAHIWVINTVMPSETIKREGQIYIHTKHWAGITLKKFYLDASTVTDVPEDVERWRHNGRCMDYVLTGSRFDTESFRRGFDFHKEAVQVGSPRTDAMFRMEECRRKVAGHYHLNEKHKLLLYAPTYRYGKNGPGVHVAEAGKIGLDYGLIQNALQDRFGGEWDILLRLHPSVAKESGGFAADSHVTDVSAYPDSEELAAACDVMVSDYSSIMFEPAFVKKPVFLFAPDREEYIGHEYDLLLDYDVLPFPIAETNEELAQCITEFDQAAYEGRVTAFLEEYGVREDGHASERAAEFIMGLCGKD